MARDTGGMSECPCGSGHPYARCCEPYLDGAPAPTAEALMRSRYTAYVLRNEDHLFRTWHPRTRPSLPYTDREMQWTGLRIDEVVAGQVGDSTGVVEFVASWVGEDGRIASMRERSRFERRGGRWVYVEGDVREGR